MGSNQDRPYRDETWLREKYVVEELSQREIADLARVSQKTVANWMDKHEIPADGKRGSNDTRFRDPDWLREKYVEEGLSTWEVADLCGCSQTTIRDWLGRHSIDTRARKRPPKTLTESFYSEASRQGDSTYEKWTVSDCGEVHTVRVHRLLAVAEHGFGAVVGNHVHHVTNLGWDNRPGNVVPLPADLHAELHHSKESAPYPIPDEWKPRLWDMGVEL